MSISSRFLFNIFGNFLRSIISFITGILLARWLNPEKFGEYSFLLVSFTSLKVLTDLAVSSAFFTFISKIRRSKIFILYYWGWLFIQVLLPLIIIAIILPDKFIELIWDTSDKKYVLLALLANTMQGAVWTTASQLGESQRRNKLVQLIGVLTSAFNLISISILFKIGFLEISNVFILLIVEWGLASVIVAQSYRTHSFNISEGKIKKDTLKSIFSEYKHYCQPLFFYGLLSFIYEFSDRWMLQHWGGKSEQAYFSVALTFSSIALLATTSTLNIFWKEISEASHKNDEARVALLYQKFKHILFFSATFISCALIPWHKEIIKILVGESYNAGALSFMIMCLYPIHQTIGQVDGTLMYSTGETKLKMRITIWFTIGSLLFTYLSLAPKTAFIPGLGLASIGMAIKMVLFQLICVNIINYIIARKFKWDYQIRFQFLTIFIFLSLAFLTYNLSNYLLGQHIHFFIKIGFGIFLYLLISIMIILKFPSIAGLTLGEPEMYLNKILKTVRFKI